MGRGGAGLCTCDLQFEGSVRPGHYNISRLAHCGYHSYKQEEVYEGRERGEG